MHRTLIANVIDLSQDRLIIQTSTHITILLLTNHVTSAVLSNANLFWTNNPTTYLVVVSPGNHYYGTDIFYYFIYSMHFRWKILFGQKIHSTRQCQPWHRLSAALIPMQDALVG